jgi:hypothetical protein
MLEDERDGKAWKDFIGQKEVWIVPHSARHYFGLNPERIVETELKAVVEKNDKMRREIIDRITRAVRAGKTVSALQWGEPMMSG